MYKNNDLGTFNSVFTICTKQKIILLILESLQTLEKILIFIFP